MHRFHPLPGAISWPEYEQEIEDLRHRLDLMVGRNPVPMLVTTPAFSIVEANDAYVQMSGIAEDALKNTSLTGFRIISQSVRVQR